jgi:hypothetical protein
MAPDKANQAGANGGQPPQDGVKAQEDQARARPFWLAVGIILSVSFLFTLALPTVIKASTVFVLLALGALSAGGIVGFLFGIPQARSSAVTTSNDEASYQPSNSLEQISDWLTKIIVGVGLVEFKEVEQRLAALGRLVHQATGSSVVVPQILVVIFGATGFAAAYMWTRLSYAKAQTEADSEVMKLRRELRQLEENVQIKDEGTKMALEQQSETLKEVSSQKNALSLVALPESATDSAQAPAGTRGLPAITPEWTSWESKFRKFMAAEPDWDEDTTAEIFGSRLPHELHGRRLEVSVISKTGSGLFLKARVSGTADSPLPGKVIFLLHPSYNAGKAQEVVATREKNGFSESATYSFYAADGFTLVAMADAGKTVLGYDLQPLFD